MKKQKGITLIALIITIIIMLILVGVSVTVALNGGLFSTAQKATEDTETERDKELALSDGRVKVNGVWYDSMEDYVANKPSENQGGGSTGGEDDTGSTGPATYETNIEGLAETVTLVGYEDLETETNADIKAAVDAGKISAVLKENLTINGETVTYTAVVPTGYNVSTTDGEDSIAKGLVIYDGTAENRNNEFVWTPMTTDIGESYSYENGKYTEPKLLTETNTESNGAVDSQTTLDYLYGEGYYSFEEDFKYAEEYAQMVENVNKYDGFYVGRYETTIDANGNVGSEVNTPLLVGSTTYTNNGTTYNYRWYGIYYAQKNANVANNGQNIQTAMIYGVLWDKTMDFIRTQNAAGITTYDVDSATSDWHPGSGEIVNSGQLNPGATGDVALNIWDLESNAYEWTQEASDTRARTMRGGFYYNNNNTSNRGYSWPENIENVVGSRMVLYIK